MDLKAIQFSRILLLVNNSSYRAQFPETLGIPPLQGTIVVKNARLGVRRAGSIFQFNADSQCSVGRVEGTSKGLELCGRRYLVPSKEYEMPC